MHEMEYKRQTESELAKLMGLEKPLTSRIIRHGRQRVLSESYLQDIARICQQQKWSFNRFSMNADVRMLERKDRTEEENLFKKLWLLNSVQDSGRKVRSPKKMQSALQKNEKKAESTDMASERDCVGGREALRYGSMEANGIAKQVANELQNSVWHDVLSLVRPDGKKGMPKQCTSNSMSSTSSKCRNKKFNVHKDWCLNLVSEGTSICKSSQKVNCISEEETTPANSTAITSLHSEMDVSCEFGETRSPKESSTCSDMENLTSENEEAVVDAFMPLHQADNQSIIYQMEAHKLHHDSTSNFKDTSSAPHGSEIKLQQSTSTIPGIYQTVETQILSYLIDILAESGLQCGNLERYFKLGQPPLENLLNPFVFDSLEKKYSKQPSWVKSDCKLLFDRIKGVLADAVCPNTWHKYKKNRLLLHCSQDMIREELLSVLVSQEKEAKRVSSDKAVGIDCNWLELEEDIQMVVKEIEENLIDKLMEEIVSTELLI